jgi:hypothetical protein
MKSSIWKKVTILTMLGFFWLLSCRIAYRIGQDNCYAVEVANWGLTLPVNTCLLLETNDINHVVEYNNKVLDCNLIGAIYIAQSRFLLAQSRKEIRIGLRDAFRFRETHPYVLIDKNKMTDDFNKTFLEARTLYERENAGKKKSLGTSRNIAQTNFPTTGF